MLFVGIDLGTSAVKLLLMEEDGRIVKITNKEYPISFPRPGWSEQNPSDWFDGTMEGLRELLCDVDRSEVGGISFGGQMHGLVVLDDKDEVIRPAILWNDGRTGEEVAYLNEQIGRDKISTYTGNIAFAGFTAPKILWMQKHEPENFARISKIMLPKDYLSYRLSGAFCTDYSDASGMLLLDVEHKCWSSEMLDICGITKNQLPALHESYEVVGTLLPKIAETLGLPASVRVIAGAGDNAAAAVGTGTVGDGACNISLGTSGTIFIASDTFGVDPHNALHSFAHADGHYHRMGCMLSAASCNKWWMDEILREADYSGAQREIKWQNDSGMRKENSALGHNHVYFLPYLMGERSPHNDPSARGAFIGMSLDTTRADMMQAVFEGVAFAMRDSLEIARSQNILPKRTKICGGGAKSPLWCEIMANVLDLQVDLLAVEEGPALGAAMLAAVGCGVYESVEAAAKAIVRVADTVAPEAALVDAYNERYQLFRQLYPALRGIYSFL